MKMKRRRARPDVRAVVLAGERIHGVLAEIAFLRGQRHGFASGFGERDLVEANRAIHVKQNAPRVLADGLRLVLRQRNILVNDLESVGCEGVLLLVFQRRKDGLVDVTRDFSRGPADQFEQGVLQFTHKLAKPRSITVERQHCATSEIRRKSRLSGWLRGAAAEKSEKGHG